ncbi:MAG: TolC family protein, partial [Rectinemataceae bacterium]
LEGAVAQFQERLDAGDPDVEELDRFRLAAALAEIRARASEAERGQRSARAALSLVAGIERFRVTECALEPVDLELRPLAWYQQAARLHRPESGMLQAGIEARQAAVSAARGFYFPDIALVLNASFSVAPGRTRQNNPFIFDPTNQPQLGALLVARWNLDFAGTYFRTARAEAQLLDTEAQVDEARLGISLEVATSYEEVRDAQRRLQSWLRGFRDARAWFVAAAQAYEVGTLDPAALRRFAFKVGFKPLTEERRLTLFRRYFPEVELTIEAAERLARLEGLTPGDFKAVKTRAHFSLCMDADGVVEALAQECGYRTRSRPIGFIATTTS